MSDSAQITLVIIEDMRAPAALVDGELLAALAARACLFGFGRVEQPAVHGPARVGVIGARHEAVHRVERALATIPTAAGCCVRYRVTTEPTA